MEGVGDRHGCFHRLAFADGVVFHVPTGLFGRSLYIDSGCGRKYGRIFLTFGNVSGSRGVMNGGMADNFLIDTDCFLMNIK